MLDQFESYILERFSPWQDRRVTPSPSAVRALQYLLAFEITGRETGIFVVGPEHFRDIVRPLISNFARRGSKKFEFIADRETDISRMCTGLTIWLGGLEHEDSRRQFNQLASACNNSTGRLLTARELTALHLDTVLAIGSLDDADADALVNHRLGRPGPPSPRVEALAAIAEHIRTSVDPTLVDLDVLGAEGGLTVEMLARPIGKLRCLDHDAGELLAARLSSARSPRTAVEAFEPMKLGILQAKRRIPQRLVISSYLNRVDNPYQLIGENLSYQEIIISFVDAGSFPLPLRATTSEVHGMLVRFYEVGSADHLQAGAQVSVLIEDQLDALFDRLIWRKTRLYACDYTPVSALSGSRRVVNIYRRIAE